jgi:serine/threonine protein phosphatase PrpC
MSKLVLTNAYGQVLAKQRHKPNKKITNFEKRDKACNKQNETDCQDSVIIQVNSRRQFVAALDVMGSVKNLTGEEAKKTFRKQLKDTKTISEGIEKTIRETPLASTLDLAEIQDNIWSFYHIGDGGILLIREGNIIFRTTEHTHYEKRIRHLLPENADQRPYSRTELIELFETIGIPNDLLSEISSYFITSGPDFFSKSTIKQLIESSQFTEAEKILEYWKDKKTRKKAEHHILATFIIVLQQSIGEALNNPGSIKLKTPTLIKAEEGDIVTCFTDGITGNLSEDEISKRLSNRRLTMNQRITSIIKTAKELRYTKNGKIDDLGIVAAEATQDRWSLKLKRRLGI